MQIEIGLDKQKHFLVGAAMTQGLKSLGLPDNQIQALVGGVALAKELYDSQQQGNKGDLMDALATVAGNMALSGLEFKPYFEEGKVAILWHKEF